MEESLWKIYPIKFYKGCLPQILLGPLSEYFVPNIALERIKIGDVRRLVS